MHLAPGARPPDPEIGRARLRLPGMDVRGPEGHLSPPGQHLRVAGTLLREGVQKNSGLPVPLLPGQDVGKAEPRLHVPREPGQDPPVLPLPSAEIPREAQGPREPDPRLPVPGVGFQHAPERGFRRGVLPRPHLGGPPVHLVPGGGRRRSRGEEKEGKKQDAGADPPSHYSSTAGRAGTVSNPFRSNFSQPVFPKW
jgi:hypothetical protein